MHDLHIESLESGLEIALDDGEVAARHRAPQRGGRRADGENVDLLALLKREATLGNGKSAITCEPGASHALGTGASTGPLCCCVSAGEARTVTTIASAAASVPPTS